MKPDLHRKRFSQISLSSSCKSIILGSVLGDGSLKIYPKYKNARFWIRHSLIQKEYMYWKINNLNEISSPSSMQLQDPTGYSQNKKLLYQSKACEELSLIHELLYSENHLKIKRSWLNHLTPLSLAIWWLDDGSIIGNGKRGVLCTDPFSQYEHKLLKRYLEVAWGITARIGTLNRIYKGKQKQVYRLYLNNESLKCFLRLIMRYAPVESMIYKYCLLYKDPKLQERWISEMVAIFPEWEVKIREIIKVRKLRLKYFRK